jgi:hypothetical protein
MWRIHLLAEPVLLADPLIEIALSEAPFVAAANRGQDARRRDPAQQGILEQTIDDLLARQPLAGFVGGAGWRTRRLAHLPCRTIVRVDRGGVNMLKESFPYTRGYTATGPSGTAGNTGHGCTRMHTEE